MREGSSRLEHFDGLRAVAALSVFALHGGYQIAVRRPEDAWWYPWGVHLGLGVSLFFAISGFLLYRVFLEATLGGRGVDVRAYAWRRLVRIVPAYWVALAGIGLWVGFDDIRSLGDVARFALFAQVYDSRTALGGIGQAWSLDVEMAFYVVLPLFALVLFRARTLRTAALGCLGFVAVGVLWKVLAVAVVDFSAPDTAAWFFVLPAHMDALGAGMLVAVLVRAPQLPRAVAVLVARPAVAWGAAALVFVAIGLVSDGGLRAGPLISDPQYLVTRTLYAVVAVLVILPAAFPADGRGAIRGLLRWTPLRLLGVVSYSFYLWHLAVVGQALRWFGETPSGWGWLAWTGATLGLSVALAVVSYRLVERPAMRLRGVVPPRGRSAAVDAAQAAP